MSEKRSQIIENILSERLRQFDLPGSEFDTKNTPNDWASIISHYLHEHVRRGDNTPLKDDFESGLVKAAAIIVAALEHIDIMKNKGDLK